jgi:hypothetical protein
MLTALRPAEALQGVGLGAIFVVQVYMYHSRLSRSGCHTVVILYWEESGGCRQRPQYSEARDVQLSMSMSW